MSGSWSRATKSTVAITPRVCGMSNPSTPRKTFEYSTVPLITHATKAILDTWGEDGWELVQVVPGPNPEQLVAYLKRERA